MRRLIAVSGLVGLGLSACSPPAPPPSFEAVAVSGSQSQGDDFVKMNTATGEAWFHCCGSANGSFAPVRDDQAPPPGDYHLVRWNQVDERGEVNWNVYRFDRKTGHTWVLLSSDKGGESWMDVNSSGKGS